MNILEILTERGFVNQITHEKELTNYINEGQVTCYIGFDPTASSLHIGSLIPIMALAHMQRCGHKPIALVGGGTGLVGDPSGKTEMRKLLDNEKIEKNINGLKKQLSNFLDFSDNKALLLNNADWLRNLQYITFLRDIGRHFSVNKMIKAESYKTRIESDEGLNFIEFNYMLLQAYDFLQLFESKKCRIQMGGADQWGNIVAGIDLVRRVCGETVFGITFPLITTSSGRKMGKTEKDALWLDPEKTSPYEYYQFWINTDDRDINRFLLLFTFLPIEEIKDFQNKIDNNPNHAKAVLAYETTKIAHGKDEADKAFYGAAIMFGEKVIPDSIFPSSKIPRNRKKEKNSVPNSSITKEKLEKGIIIFKLFNIAELTKSGGEARRLIKQGGAYINDERIKDDEYIVTTDDFKNGKLLLRAGKKRYHQIIMS